MAYFHRRSSSAKAQPMIPTVDAVAATVFAFRTQGNKIEKYDVTAQPEQVYSDYTAPAVAAVTSNKTLAFAALDNATITQADRDEAQEVISYVQGQVTMALLAGKPCSDFVKELAKALEETEVPRFKIGLLVYAPNVRYTGEKREAINEQTTELLYTSQALGAVGQKVEFNFTLIEKRYVQAFDMFSAYGKDDAGNLVNFLTKHEALAADGKKVGKIKKAEADKWHGNAMVTSLNYVKAAA